MAELRQRLPTRGASAAPPSPPDHDDKPRSHTAKASAAVPSAFALIGAFVLFHVAVVGTIAHFHTWLPAPAPLDAPPDAFSEARARVVLDKIMSFGYRPVGSNANDVLTPAYLLSEIEKIKAAASPGVSIEVDVQKPTGAFGLNFLAQFQNIYANVTNIVVRLATTTPPHGVDVLENSLMLSSHYDAAFGAAAASDDGVSIAIMMEVLRIFAQEPPTHGSLIFNFNGAEETILQAAHGFITQHKWTKHIKAFINLEAAGAGGRELLFQTSSDELALAYAEGAKYPHASIIGQELFQTGVIPADTDFRVYRDFGAIAGMDFAYIANGYVYHTMLDDVSRIQPGAVQRLGDNVVGVVKRLVNRPGRLAKIASTPHSSNTLFFDVVGLFMVSAGKDAAFRICGGVVIASIFYLKRSPITLDERLVAMKLMWTCIGAALGASLCMALLLTLFAPLSWYTVPYLGAAAFVTPALAAMVDRLARFLRAKTQQESYRPAELLWRVEESLFEAMLVTWLLGLIALLVKHMLSSYIMAVWIAFPLAGHVICRVLRHLKLLPSSLYVTISLAAVAIPVVHSGSVLVLAFMFFVPLLGRSGTVLPPDIVVAVLFVLSLLVMLSFSCRFFCFVSPSKLFALRDMLIGVSILSLLVSTLVNPYSVDTPKRLMVQHVHRDVRLPNGSIVTQDSGIWFNAVDFRGFASIKPYLAATRWKNAALVPPPKALVDKLGLYGDMPYGKPVREMLPERHSWYLPASPPEFTDAEPPAPDLQVLSSKYDAATDRRTVHLLLTGPAHLGIFIDATKTTLTSWSIGEGVNGPAPHKNGTYILQFATGEPPAAFHFWLEAKTANAIELSVVGHHLEKETPEMRELIDALPAWTHSAGFVSTWSMRSV